MQEKYVNVEYAFLHHKAPHSFHFLLQVTDRFDLNPEWFPNLKDNQVTQLLSK